ncbi:hypothetical protein GCM10018793_17030 [Streptomyces sulfonofaciens]|uniref:Uncharacterized protein n=1 Tax=Streptomyces sulfonofaciens TaxID=68272 RepID=A0A919FZQ5_9ACTN|nr:hypothetical protein GCM10018793_17030 [Streptomyces sulfonofaciens]
MGGPSAGAGHRPPVGTPPTGHTLEAAGPTAAQPDGHPGSHAPRRGAGNRADRPARARRAGSWHPRQAPVVPERTGSRALGGEVRAHPPAPGAGAGAGPNPRHFLRPRFSRTRTETWIGVPSKPNSSRSRRSMYLR